MSQTTGHKATAQNQGFFMVPGYASICLAQWEVQNSGSQTGVLESLDDACAFGVVFGDIFKGEYKLKRMGCYIAASDKLQYITVRSIGEACCH